jgi:hypothetical protein
MAIAVYINQEDPEPQSLRIPCASEKQGVIAMKISITDTILKRLVNYENVMRRKLDSAEKRQWTDMTLENMQEFEKVREQARSIFALAGYGLYLYKVQKGLREATSVYGEPLLHNALVDLLNELNVPVQFIEAAA